MVIAGAIELDTSTVLTILAIFAIFFVGLCLTGGLLAWAIARQKLAFLGGTLAFGLTAAWLVRHLGPAQAVVGGWLASSVVGAVGVALREARLAAGPAPPETHARDSGPSRPRVGVVAPAVVGGGLVVAGAATLGLLGPISDVADGVSEWRRESRGSEVETDGLPVDDQRTGRGQAPSATDPCGEPVEPSFENTGPCGVSFEDLRDMNLSYADRLDFAGDPEAAEVVADEVHRALTAVAGNDPAPSPHAVRQALDAWQPEVEVADNAVRTAGTAFAVGVEGGCVFGSIHDGQVEVAVGGYIRDGGCLAVYGH